jgi:hypothetical protein
VEIKQEKKKATSFQEYHILKYELDEPTKDFLIGT